jgi:hypothetical protein
VLVKPGFAALDRVAHALVPHPLPAAALGLRPQLHQVPRPPGTEHGHLHDPFPVGAGQAVAVGEDADPPGHVEVPQQRVDVARIEKRCPPQHRVEHLIGPGGRLRQVEVDQRVRPAVTEHDVLWRDVDMPDQLRRIRGSRRDSRRFG